MSADTVAVFRRRIRSYFLRVVILLVVAPLVLYALRLALPGDTGGLLVGLAALIGVVGGAYLIHWKTVRCPACERWLVPLGMNGFAPAACPNCKTPLR